MDPKQAQAMWQKFDEAAKGATSPETVAVVMALKAMTEVINARLATLEITLLDIARRK